MHTVSETWKTLAASEAHRTEVKLVIAGTEYGESEIVRQSLRVYGGIFEEFGIGNCCARQIDFTILPKGEIPRQAKTEVYVRLRLGETASEWLQKGVFFFSTRETDGNSSALRVHGYDAMLKSEEIWLDSRYDNTAWPMPVQDAVNDIADRMGVALDERTVLNTAFPVQYPADEQGDMTMREVLGRIAVANAGNWVITDEGKLRLIPLTGEAVDTADYLADENGNALTFGGLRIRL